MLKLLWGIGWLTLGILLVVLLALAGFYGAGREIVNVGIIIPLVNLCALVLPAVVSGGGMFLKISRHEGRVAWAIVVGLIGAAVGSIANGKVDSVKRAAFLRGFEIRLLEEKNSEDIHKWALTVIESNKAEDEKMADAEVPDWLRRLFPKHGPDIFVFRERSASEKYVKAVWGGGFQHWGMVIGSDSYAMYTGPNQVMRPLKPGVYLYVER